MFSLSFLKRLGEESVHAFLGGFALVAVSGDFGKATLFGGLLAGFRGVMGVLLRNFGDDVDRPSFN